MGMAVSTGRPRAGGARSGSTAYRARGASRRHPDL